jgi:antitoxin CptB
MISNIELNRMRWAARRGMLELDLVLAPFVEACYADLPDIDRARFEQLMLCEDQDLFAWFLRREQSQDPEMVIIVKQILEFAATRTDD